MGQQKLQQVALRFIFDCSDRGVERGRMRYVHLLWRMRPARRAC